MNARANEDFPLIYLFIFSISLCQSSHCQGENIEENEEGNAMENSGKKETLVDSKLPPCRF